MLHLELEIKECALQSGAGKIIELITSSEKEVLAAIYFDNTHKNPNYYFYLWKAVDVIKESGDPFIHFNLDMAEINATALSKNGQWLACADNTNWKIHIWSLDYDTRSTVKYEIDFESISEDMSQLEAMAWQQTAGNLTLIVQSTDYKFWSASLPSLLEQCSQYPANPQNALTLQISI